MTSHELKCIYFKGILGQKEVRSPLNMNEKKFFLLLYRFNSIGKFLTSTLCRPILFLNILKSNEYVISKSKYKIMKSLRLDLSCIIDIGFIRGKCCTDLGKIYEPL